MRIDFKDLVGDNLDQAVSYFRQSITDGTWTADTAHALLHLQSDPGPLIEAMIAARKELNIPIRGSLRGDRGPVGAVTKGAGRSAGGKGYNPYRAGDGKFAPGAHKEKPKGTTPARLTAVHALIAARIDPSSENIRAARIALELARSAWRYDRASGSITKGTGRSASGKGYNPYRAGDGKFGSGAHKERPKTGTAARAAQPRPSGRTAPAHVTSSEKHAKKTAARVAVDKAKREPTAKNIKAARDAVAEARSGAPTHAATHAKPKADRPHHDTASEASGMVAADPRRRLSEISHVDTSDGRSGRQFTPESQAALRAHMNDAVARYGMQDRGATLPESGRIEVRTNHSMAGAMAQYYPATGKMTLDEATAGALREHGMHNPSDLGKRLAHEDDDALRMVGAYRAAVHETVHGHGPAVDFSRHGIMLEEMATEMSARKVVADAHGVSVWDVRTVGSYTHYISPTVSSLSDISGRSRPEAHEALAQAAMDFKRSSRSDVAPEAALKSLGANALQRLGVHDETHVNDLHSAMLAASEGV